MILCIETSSKVCSVSICNDNEILFNKENHDGLKHAEQLPLFVQEALQFCRQQKINLQAIAVSSGPGSYTGLRIGVSTAKGLCFGLNLPLIAIGTLRIMADSVQQFVAQQSNANNTLLCPMLDARRMEVYTALIDTKNNIIEPEQAKIIDENSFSHQLSNQTIYFFGDGMDKCKPLLSTSINAQFVENIFPLAKNMGSLAKQAYDNQQFENVAYYEPFYLKDFIATTPKKQCF